MDRLRMFKNKGRDAETLRNKRQESDVELRKQRRDDQLFKKRNVAMSLEEISPLKEIPVSPNKSTDRPIMSLEEIDAGVRGQDPVMQLQATQCARRILSKEKNPPIDEIVKLGLIPIWVKFLYRDENPTLQFEAAWSLTNVASGNADQTQMVVDAGAVDAFVRLLGSSHQNVCEQSVWALANIAGDGPTLRDVVTRAGIVKALLALVDTNPNTSLLANITWCISNLCRHKNPAPNFTAVRQVLPVLARFLHHSDRAIVTDACWSLSYITDGPGEQIEAVSTEEGVVRRLITILAESDVNVQTPCLRTLGNIVTGTDIQTQRVLEAGLLNVMPDLLNHPKANIRKEAAWTLSNITAGNSDQIQYVFDHGCIEPLVKLIQCSDYKCQREACWALSNITCGGTQEQTVALVQAGALEPLCTMLEAKEAKLIVVVLEALRCILGVADRLGDKEKLCIFIEEIGALDKIENLQNHENEDVFIISKDIIDKYFSDEGEEDTGVAPQAADDQFEFSAPESSNGNAFQF